MVFTLGSITALVLAVFVIIGGVIGFLKAQSIMSLVAGVVSAVLLAGCAYAMSINPTYGLIGAIVVASMLEGIFVIRLKKTKKFMPAGMMLAACLLAQVAFIVDFVLRSSKQ